MQTLTVGGAQVLVLADAEAVAREAIERTVTRLREAIADRGEAHLVLTGGSSAVALYRDLANPAWRSVVDWESVHLWWGDDRFVPADHPDSNAGLAFRLLLAWSARMAESGTGAEGVDVDAGEVPGLWIPAANVHPIPMESTIGNDATPAMAADRYAAEIERWAPKDAAGLPAFDVIHAGVGGDGHILSIFPGSPALEPDAPVAMAIDAPTHIGPHLPRVTLAARVLRPAGLVLVMASGSGKAHVLKELLGGESDARRWPSQAALLPSAVWLLDRAAASGIGEF